MTPREERGFLLAAMFKIVQKNGIWLVPSQTKPGKTYHVNLILGTCNCEDHKEWVEPCKHMIATEIVAQREGAESKLVGDLRSSIEKAQKKTYKQNWAAYNLAQTIEKDRFLVLLADLAKLAQTPGVNKTGRPRVPISDVVFATAFKVYSTLSTRRFSCDLKAALERATSPDRSTTTRCAPTSSGTSLRRS